MIKRPLLILTLILTLPAVMANAQPLRMVEADSVVLYDFFWYGVQRSADSIIGETAREWPWALTTDDADAVAIRRVNWKRSLEDMHLEGALTDSVSKADELLPLLRESVELGLMTGEARYFDVAERMLANSMMRMWKFYQAWKWRHETLTQVMRSVGSMAYATRGRDIYINMFMRSNVHVKNDVVDFCMQVFNSSPWYNDTSIRITKDMSPIEQTAEANLSPYHRLIVREEAMDSVDLTFHIRIPSWTNGQDMLPRYATQCKKQPVIIMVNGNLYTPEVVDGYAIVKGRWAAGDLINVKVPTPILRVSHPDYPDMVALQRGPIVYCTHFDYAATKAHLNLKEPISHYFDNKVHSIALKTVNENQYGKLNDVLFPYCHFGTQRIFMPAK
ncbi:MAG: glycoside hydrolase family 127 protein [Bacteroidaceae bacterium]|nr:glycoside hydrolase family 127 protein [Bacteroidaceae bacterium]MBP5731853.1 glycoside hydrolase family 127 protein [Bacteroidaceae bacterium]